MSRPKRYDERVDVTVRIDPDLKTQLRRVADERLVSMSFVIDRAIRDLLDRLAPVDEVFK